MVPQRRFASVRRITIAVCALLFAGALSAQRPADPHFVIDEPADMTHIKLELDVDVPSQHVDGVATLQLQALRPTESLTFDAVDFSISDTRVATGDGEPTDARRSYDDKNLTVYLPRDVKRGDAITVIVKYAIDKPKNGLHFFKPSEDGPEIPNLVWSQGESLENRFWIPCYDHPNDRQTSELIVRADADYLVVSNGKLLSTTDLVTKEGPPRKEWHWSQDKPHASYLITMVVGELSLVEETWHNKPVRYYVPRGREKDALRTFGHTTKMLDVFGKVTGIPYPWDQYAQVCCYAFGGGMENTSATTLGATSVQDERGAIDANVDDLIAHELAHQWWGDLVTCREWAHIWLNEGFASYFEAVWLENTDGRDDYLFDMLEKQARATAGGKAQPIVDRYYENADDLFDARAYPKGAWVLHMLRDRIGDDLFWKTLHDYGTAFAMSNAETDDLRRVAERVSGASLEQFFHDWTKRPGHPQVEVSYHWKPDDSAAEITVKQSAQVADSYKKDGKLDPASPEARPFEFPLTIEFRVGDTAPVVVTREISSAELTFQTPLPAAPTIVSVDPDLAVLMELKETKSRELWLAQLKSDPHVISRVRAIRSLTTDVTDETREAVIAALDSDAFWGVRREAARALGKMGGDAAADALLHGLADKDQRVRRECVAQLDEFPRIERVEAALRKIVETGDVSYRVETEAIRSFGRIAPDDAVAVLELALERPSLNETIRSAAIDALADTQSPEAIPLLASWCERGKPLTLRRDAIRAINRMADAGALSEEQRTSLTTKIAPYLAATEPRLRSATCRCLRALGAAAESTVKELNRIARNDDNEEVRKAARDAADAIRKDDPLKKQVDDLRKQIDRLKKKVHSLEKPGKKAKDVTADSGDDTASGEDDDEGDTD